LRSHNKAFGEAVREGELKRVLGRYPLGELRDARRAEQGFVNENWIVETARGRYFLKRRHPRLRRPDLILAQHELIGRLQRAGFPAPTVVPTISGDTVLLLGGELYDIQEYIEGEPYDHERLAHLEEAALTLGRYHIHVEGFAPQALCPLGELYSPPIMRRILSGLTAAWQLDRDPDLAETAQRLEAHAADLAGRFAEHRALPYLIIHGDYYAGNLLFESDRIIGVVDYDKARWQPRVVELAEALIYFASPRAGHLQHLIYPGFLNWEPFFHFLQGYGQAAVLKEEEMGALPDYVRSIWLSMSLKRLLEEGSRPTEALEALQEVLALCNWAEANANQMVEAAHAAMPRW
jgi:homoserine kinase type II